ncbi:MAG TPA: transcription elongation factor GreA [Flavobacteriales bacterium]|jgi:transcription elongation factor GreA|nr:transcription elongation factor GreA [Flavobacteriales bacterium]
MSKIIYLTPEGLENLKKELEYLKFTEMPEITKRISEARDKGDLSENAEYHAAKEEQVRVNNKIHELQMTLANARILDDKDLDTSKVLIFSTVKIKNLKTGKEKSYTLVSANEADPLAGKISVDSPIGKGLLGKSVGEIAEIDVPAGKLQLEVLEITR